MRPSDSDHSGSERDGEYYPLRAADFAAIGLFWLMVAMISAVSRNLDPRIPDIPNRVASAVITGTYIEYALWAVLTVPLWWIATRYSIEGGRRVGRMLLFVVAGIAIAILVDSFLFKIREELMVPLGRFRRRPPAPLVGLGFLDDLMVYFAVLGAGIARDYFLRYRTRIVETTRLQAQLTQARLDALRSQLNPHFLFNTLNAVSALVERDPRGVRRMIARLSDLLRHTLDDSNAAEITLSKELDVLEEYIELMQIRFQGKLDIAMHISEDTRFALVPNLILQPLVENALEHGVSKATGVGRIELRSQRSGDRLVITLTDNGPGQGDADAGRGDGIGLTNTNARLRELYGPIYRVQLRAAANGGTQAELTLPYHTSAVKGGVALG
jgi:two-component system LytT family sensor kinase